MSKKMTLEQMLALGNVKVAPKAKRNRSSRLDIIDTLKAPYWSEAIHGVQYDTVAVVASKSGANNRIKALQEVKGRETECYQVFDRDAFLNGDTVLDPEAIAKLDACERETGDKKNRPAILIMRVLDSDVQAAFLEGLEAGMSPEDAFNAAQ